MTELKYKTIIIKFIWLKIPTEKKLKKAIIEKKRKK
tara:strand:+ start:1458 stop:1565 length:108 start_codon:yes stop_codon:yes gene_type:complete